MDFFKINNEILREGANEIIKDKLNRLENQFRHGFNVLDRSSNKDYLKDLMKSDLDKAKREYINLENFFKEYIDMTHYKNMFWEVLVTEVEEKLK